MLNLFQQHIATQFPDLNRKKIGIAISGGVDSVVLADLCLCSGISIALLHCNFQLRGANSNGDQSFVKRLSETWEVPLITTEFNTRAYIEIHKTSVQVGARELRYKWFYKMKNVYDLDWIATAHHADDNLETFLMNLSRGTGLNGLTGIPQTNGAYIRPLLPFSKETIIAYAKERELQWREDASNKEIKYLRNKYRHTVVPAIKEIQPKILSNFNATIAYLKQTQAVVNAYVSNFKEKNVKLNKEINGFQVPIKSIEDESQPGLLLFELLKDYGFTAWTDATSLLMAQSGKKIFSPSHILLKDRDHLLLYPRKEAIEENYSIVNEDTNLRISNLGTLVLSVVEEKELNSKNVVFLNKKTLTFPLTVRKWKEGDYFYPSGMNGKKKLSKYFKDEKFSIPQKETTWLLCFEEEVVWVIGYRADKRFLADKKTKETLRLTFKIDSN